MTDEIEKNRLKIIFLSSLTVILSGFFSFINFSEWYIVKIQNRISEYPFGGEGSTPYYYKTADLYSAVNFFSGLIFLTVFLFATWTVIRGKRKLTLISLGVTLILIFAMYINGQF